MMWEGIVVLLRIGAMVYIGLLLVLAGCQRSMMYYPTTTSEANAINIALADGMEPWRDEDGGLVGWRYMQFSEDADAMLVFHGNAGFAGQRGYLAHGFAPDFAVHIMEYPGYGSRPGRPSEQAFFEAAREAFELLSQQHSGRIFLGGESIGTGVATYIASQFPDRVAGLFLVTPYTSLVDVARSHYPIFPVRLLMRDRFPSETFLAQYSGPVAFVVAEHDEVVPARLGKALYAGYEGPKRLWIQEGRNHNTLDYHPLSPWWSEVREFLHDHASME